MSWSLDVVVVGTGDKAQETARRKRFGWGSLGALERAKRARARGLRVYKERWYPYATHNYVHKKFRAMDTLSSAASPNQGFL